MGFKNIINEIELNEKAKVTMDSFLSHIGKYNTLDAALEELPSEYLEFYSNNTKALSKAIHNMFEEYSPEGPGDIGQAKTETKTIKKIKYKGELFTLVFDPEIGSWQAIPAFRSITQALKYGKAQIDDVKALKAPKNP